MQQYFRKLLYTRPSTVKAKVKSDDKLKMFVFGVQFCFLRNGEFKGPKTLQIGEFLTLKS